MRIYLCISALNHLKVGYQISWDITPKYFSLLQNADILQLYKYLMITYSQVQHDSLKASTLSPGLLASVSLSLLIADNPFSFPIKFLPDPVLWIQLQGSLAQTPADFY